MSKINREQTEKKFQAIASARLSTNETNIALVAVLVDALIEINGSICELTEAVQASQPS